ncbi:hypothetical protein BT63DRAFT_449897 [Microthyrium microscopicum]|uniref:NADH dehydrogenase [ubiquinone] 1 alpha subcomplex subunit 1 n=1 Tax=Microthyrium microscopicum TaxID=703497 RepID=A0A6A6UT11_9PEZI|nr:hypothetical protein BT63DRAFT_449897 [Microthyrium microscopicum]
MGIPFETFIPYALMFGLTVFTGVSMTGIKTMQSGGKWPRYNIDRWDQQSKPGSVNDVNYQLMRSVVMDRDRRLTGYLRGQSDKPEAPDGFELSNGWKVEDRIF